MSRYRLLLNAAALPLLALAASPAAAIDWQRFAGSTVTVLIAEHPVTDGIRALLPDFEAATGITVDVQALAEDLYFDRMELALRAPTGVADVYFLPMDSTAFTQWSAGLIKPLTPYLEDPEMTAEDYDLADFPAGFLAATQYPPGADDAEDFGIPVSFESYILFYNKDLVNEHLGGTLPPSMYHLVDAATLIKERSGGQAAGAVMRGIRSDTVIDTVTGMVFNACGDLEADLPYNIWFEGAWENPRLTEPCIGTGLAQYAGMMQAGPPNILALDWPDAALLFEQGRAGFFIDASLFGPGFENEENSAVAGKTGYALLPPMEAGGTSYTGHWMWGLGIPANAQNPDAAWYFIQWMTNKSAEPQIGARHGGAARLSTWDDPDYQAALNPEYVRVVQESMTNSRPTVVFREGWGEYALAIVSAMHEMHGTTPPEEATERLQARFLEMLNQ